MVNKEDIEIFTLSLFDKDYIKNSGRSIYIDSWKKVFPNNKITIYTDDDPLVQEAYSLGKDYIELCEKAEKLNFASNFVRLYILSKKNYTLYLDTDNYIISNFFDEMDLESNYIDIYSGNVCFDLFNIFYVGKNKLVVEKTLNFLNQTAKDILDHIKNNNVDDLTQFFSFGPLDDNKLLHHIRLDNSTKVFPQGYYLHTMSFWPLYSNLDLVIHSKPKNFYGIGTNKYCEEKVHFIFTERASNQVRVLYQSNTKFIVELPNILNIGTIINILKQTNFQNNLSIEP